MSARPLLTEAFGSAQAPSRVESEEIRYLNIFLGVKAIALGLSTLFTGLGLGGQHAIPGTLGIFGLMLIITLAQVLAARARIGRFALLATGFVLEPAFVTIGIFLINHGTGNTFLTNSCAHFALYYVGLAQAAILLRRKLVVLSGTSTLLALFALFLWLSWLEGRMTGMTGHASALHPNLSTGSQAHHEGFRTYIAANMMAVAIEAAILAVVVHIGNRVLLAWMAAERARINLARYFSPQMVEGLMQHESPTGADRRQDVAVLFVDMRGFTGLAEEMEPEAVLDLLREFHRRCEAEVFRCNGFMEKFVGDALLVAFGVPDSSDRDARNAFDCALSILVSMAAWNSGRRSAGLNPIEVGIGLHYGPAVLGDIGSERSATFAVIGDTVNVTSRLQELTKDLDSPLAASEEFVTRLASETGLPPEEQTDLLRIGNFIIEGRKNRISVWAHASRTPVPAADPMPDEPTSALAE